MYGLPQSGLIANKLLEKRLAKHSYTQSKLAPGLWTHIWRPIQFILVDNDFGVEYVGKEHAEHLVSALQKEYKITRDWEGKIYVGITLYWHHQNSPSTSLNDRIHQNFSSTLQPTNSYQTTRLTFSTHADKIRS